MPTPPRVASPSLHWRPLSVTFNYLLSLSFHLIAIVLMSRFTGWALYKCTIIIIIIIITDAPSTVVPSSTDVLSRANILLICWNKRTIFSSAVTFRSAEVLLYGSVHHQSTHVSVNMGMFHNEKAKWLHI